MPSPSTGEREYPCFACGHAEASHRERLTNAEIICSEPNPYDGDACECWGYAQGLNVILPLQDVIDWVDRDGTEWDENGSGHYMRLIYAMVDALGDLVTWKRVEAP